ncbi:MAG: exo-alpha-sialidase [Phycisphaeraceae bacterium]|nr:exo-alpha-sialidase [Phycisphaeraceae bacterium]
MYASALLVLAVTSVTARAQAIRPLASDHVVIARSPDPKTIFAYTPGIGRLDSGRLVVTMGFGGPGSKKWHETQKLVDDKGRFTPGRIFTSDDHGRTWQMRGYHNLVHARPFAAGISVYVIGHRDEKLTIMQSINGGSSWSEPVDLTSQKKHWHGDATNVWHTKGNVYLALEQRAERGVKAWEVANITPILLRARETDDLTKPEAWTMSDEFVFMDHVDYRKIYGLAAPFWPLNPIDPLRNNPIAPKREMNPVGWLETNVIQITDPDHIWYDPQMRTFYLFLRAHTGTTNLAAIAKVTEQPDGAMHTELVTAPSGKPMIYVPLPGGHMSFYVCYDVKDKLYWLLSSQSTDSMVKPDRMPADRYGLPDNERHRLVLHFSKNMIDWCFAGVVDEGPTAVQSRHYGSMAIDGDDLVVVSRSGDAEAANAHDGDIITFHRIANFRNLVY